MQVNEDGKLNESEGAQENIFDSKQGAFISKLLGGSYINVNPEYIPHAPGGLATSGRFHVLYVDLQYGTTTFYVELNNLAQWTSYHYPPFIDQEFIAWIGHQIESNYT